MLQIGDIKINSGCILAPMAGISDLPFRSLNRRFGCEFAFVEMINARSLGYRGRKTRQMLSGAEEDRPLGIQLLAGENKWLARALDIVEEYDFDLLDFNAACPARKVIRRGEGAGLLKEPRKLYSLLKLMVNGSSRPVSVKLRTGWDEHSLNCVDAARYAEDAGVSAVFIHGRTKEQGYGGSVDYGAIAGVKRAVSVPVIASGDVLSPESAVKMFRETGCDGILVARGALGNPWIFRRIYRRLSGEREEKGPSMDEICSVMKEHFDACADFYGEKNGVVIFRKFFAWYTKGMRHVRALREKACHVRSRKEMYLLIAGILSPENER